VRRVACLCGSRIDADDAYALGAAYASHIDTAHPQIEISQRRRNDAIDAIRRTGGWDGQRLPLEGTVEIVPLRPDLKDDYLRFFDGDAFADNPAWASCYCVSYTMNMPPADFDERTAAENRAERAEQIERDEASGVLAYAGGKVVGWCHAAPRIALPLLDGTAGFDTEDAATTGAIVCYVIAPAYRGQGLASRLLDAACDLLRERGLRRVDAYPPASAGTDAGSYHGRLGMYMDAGFERVRDAGRYVVVRKSL
jgi:GNAT superfamily N-acetyltransferase